MAGGISHGELQALYQVGEENNKEVLAGATSVLTPAAYLEELRALVAD
jgi:hypothetical protein